jgi:glycosyltransferase involved in cell wall biosynthesis
VKIALIFMPLNEIRPPVSSTGRCVAVDLIMDEIARRLARSHNVIAYCARGEGQPDVEEFDGVEYRRLPIALDRWFLLHHRRIMQTLELVAWRNAPQPIFNSALWYRQFIGGVVADLALQYCDIVHVMNISQFLPFIRRRLPNTRIVLHMEAQWLEHLDAAVIERRISAADLVLGCSNFIAEGVRRRFPSLAHRCSHIYNGTDIALLARMPGVQSTPQQILFVGRLAPEKGVHVLLDAFRIVLAQQPHARLKLIGPEKVIPLEALLPSHDDPHVAKIEPYFSPGAYAQLLRDKISALPPGSVSLLNTGMAFTELAPHYHSADIFVFPSVWEEPFGMPVVEAMAAGTAVIATRGGAFPEIVEDGGSGLLVERSDPRTLADAILQLLSNPKQRKAMAQAAFERASNMFSWDCIVEDLMKQYERLFEPQHGDRASPERSFNLTLGQMGLVKPSLPGDHSAFS